MVSTASITIITLVMYGYSYDICSCSAFNQLLACFDIQSSFASLHITAFSRMLNAICSISNRSDRALVVRSSVLVPIWVARSITRWRSVVSAMSVHWSSSSIIVAIRGYVMIIVAIRWCAVIGRVGRSWSYAAKLSVFVRCRRSRLLLATKAELLAVA